MNIDLVLACLISLVEVVVGGAERISESCLEALDSELPSHFPLYVHVVRELSVAISLGFPRHRNLFGYQIWTDGPETVVICTIHGPVETHTTIDAEGAVSCDGETPHGMDGQIEIMLGELIVLA